MRELVCDRGDEPFDERIILRAADALMTPTDIERVVKAFSIVGTNVEHDRQGSGRMDAATSRVKRELADRYAHAAGALVSQPENALAVGDDDHFHLR